MGGFFFRPPATIPSTPTATAPTAASVPHDGPRKRHALPHAPRKLSRVKPLDPGKPHRSKRVSHGRLHPRFR